MTTRSRTTSTCAGVLAYYRNAKEQIDAEVREIQAANLRNVAELAKDLGGWSQAWTGRWHYVLPNSNDCACGQMSGEDATPRNQRIDVPEREVCGSCRRVMNAKARKERP